MEKTSCHGKASTAGILVVPSNMLLGDVMFMLTASVL